MAQGPALMPQGESLRRALRWLDDRVKDEPKVERGTLVNEAAQRFDLSPVETEFLLSNWVRQS
jgi:hypothetical protein